MKNAFLVFVSILLSLLLGEWLIRFAAPQDLSRNFSWYQFDANYKFRHRANMDKQAAWVSPYHLKTNGRGLREHAEIPYEKSAQHRVLIFGDSFTFGNGLDKNEIFEDIAEKNLREKRGLDAEVVNMGVSAHGPSLEYLYYLNEGVKYKHDVVAVAVYLGNDVADDQRDNAFASVDGKLVATPFTQSTAKKLTNNFVYRWLADHSHLLIFLRTTLTQSLLNPAVQRQAAVLTAPVNTEAKTKQLNENIKYSVSVWQAFAESIKQENAKLVFLLLPTKNQILKQRNELGDDELQTRDLTAEKTRLSLLDLCYTQKMSCLDMTPIFAKQAENIEQGFLRGDFHYAQDFHKIIGEHLAQGLATVIN